MKDANVATIILAAKVVLTLVAVFLFGIVLYRFFGPKEESKHVQEQRGADRTCQILRHHLVLEGAEKREGEVCTLFCYAPFKTALPYLAPSSVPVSCEWYGAKVTTEQIVEK